MSISELPTTPWDFAVDSEPEEALPETARVSCGRPQEKEFFGLNGEPTGLLFGGTRAAARTGTAAGESGKGGETRSGTAAVNAGEAIAACTGIATSDGDGEEEAGACVGAATCTGSAEWTLGSPGLRSPETTDGAEADAADAEAAANPAEAADAEAAANPAETDAEAAANPAEAAATSPSLDSASPGAAPPRVRATPTMTAMPKAAPRLPKRSIRRLDRTPGMDSGSEEGAASAGGPKNGALTGCPPPQGEDGTPQPWGIAAIGGIGDTTDVAEPDLRSPAPNGACACAPAARPYIHDWRALPSSAHDPNLSAGSRAIAFITMAQKFGSTSGTIC